jgi:hypothetical protein
MTNEKMMAVVTKLRAMFVQKLGDDQSVRIDPTRHGFFAPDQVRHAIFMCDQIPAFLDPMQISGYDGIVDGPTLGRREKAMRWLGFVQGLAWCWGLCTIDEMAEMNAPDDAVHEPGRL